MWYNINIMDKDNLNKGSFVIKVVLGVVLILVIFGGIYMSTKKKVDAPVVVVPENKVEILGNKEDLLSFSVKPGDTVSGILNLSGTVKNAYFFEGNIGIGLLDANKNILKQGNGTAISDWMTTEPVTFTATIDATGLSGKGYIAIQENDPSGGEAGVPSEILIPVFFENKITDDDQKTMTVKLYFGNAIFNPGSPDCSLVYPVERVIPFTEAVATATLNELIKGPTVEEEKKGYISSIPDGVKVNSIKMEGSTLMIDFNEAAINGGGSCGQLAKRSSLFTTLQQFPTVKNIKMTVNGKGETNDFFQP